MISVQNFVVFEGEKSTLEERAMLRGAGFVHVTGLPVFSYSSKVRSGYPLQPEYLIGEKLKKEDFGHWGNSKGWLSIVTVGGEVWLRPEIKTIEPEIAELWKKLCPRGSGAFVPLCNEEHTTDIRKLMGRVADPDYRIVYKAE